MPPTLEDLRRFAVARSLFPPTTLRRAIDRLGFVQADPIRAPARAQDLILRHRVQSYRAGDLERRYAALGAEEDFFINYGFLSAEVHALLHPRPTIASMTARHRRRAEAILAFVRDHGPVHPREVDLHFAHGTVVNYWGGSSSATTHMLDKLHYLGYLRVVRRDAGIRVYGVREPIEAPADRAARHERIDALVDVIVRTYAPLPSGSLATTVGRLRWGVPQWRRELKPALQRARGRLASAEVDGVVWYWPRGDAPERARVDDQVRLLAPFDPIVWDRRRFERLWGWAYRFEAYTPVAKRKLGYYALPLLWRDRVVGWANVTSNGSALRTGFGFVAGRPPRERQFARALEVEVQRMSAFLGHIDC